MDWTPLVGVVIGGLIALLGTVLTQWAIGKREAQARQEAEAQRREWELRLAYAEWMGATQRAIIALSTMQMLPQEKQDPAALISTITTEIALLGSRVRLLEPDAAARKKTGEAVGVGRTDKPVRHHGTDARAIRSHGQARPDRNVDHGRPVQGSGLKETGSTPEAPALTPQPSHPTAPGLRRVGERAAAPSRNSTPVALRRPSAGGLARLPQLRHVPHVTAVFQHRHKRRRVAFLAADMMRLRNSTQLSTSLFFKRSNPCRACGPARGGLTAASV